MNRISAIILALGVTMSASNASAQSYNNGGYNSYNGGSYNTPSGAYDYARVIRVQPVYGSYGNYPASQQQRCYTRQDNYARKDDYYSNGYYGNDGYYNRDGYYSRNDGYYNRGGSTAGRTMATVLGGVLGAAVGSQMGDGSGRYIASTIGSMVGGIAGQQVYENNVRNRASRNATVTVCDPVSSNSGYYGAGNNAVNAYDVTYEYAGRQYTTRTNYHPGDRIRVRVDVRPD